jgi:hypothetical protein
MNAIEDGAMQDKDAAQIDDLDRPLTLTERLMISDDPDCVEAAAELTRLRERNAELEMVLEPWANAARRVNYFDGEGYDARLYALRDAGSALRELCDGIDGRPLCVSDLRRALAALASSESVKSEGDDNGCD